VFILESFAYLKSFFAEMQVLSYLSFIRS